MGVEPRLPERHGRRPITPAMIFSFASRHANRPHLASVGTAANLFTLGPTDAHSVENINKSVSWLGTRSS